MSNKTIRTIFILALLCTLAMIVTQYVWIKKAYELEKNIFHTHVTAALKNVAYYILKANNNTGAIDSIVTRVDTKYYTVQINDKIDSVVLVSLLKRELLAQQIKIDFEYSVYDCSSDKMKYGGYVNYNQHNPSDIIQLSRFPKAKKENNYFAVHFPHLNSYLTHEMTNWYISTFVLVIFLLILAYAVFIIFRQKRLSEIQKDFVNNMTHEFKTPLATIKISSEVLKNPNILNNPERLLNYATIINNETQHLTNQVERVLQMAKSGKDTLLLKKERIPLRPLLESMLDKTYRPLVRSRGGDIVIQISETDMEVFVDELHFKNVISNLLDNAIKYCSARPHIEIQCQQDKEGVSIVIQDNGIGISKENLPHIFDKFYRIPTGNLHDVKGFGLGLNYVKLICKQHGGHIKVNSVLGIGSEFCIFIPHYRKS
jgi:two-component system phosphate regulon sensor histidine kinase PhoR